MNRISLRIKIIIVLFAGIFLIAAAVFCAAASKKSGQNPPAESHEVILTNEDYFPALLKAIDEAQSEIFISIFSFKAGLHENSYPDRIMGHLAKAVKRGVKVKVILETTDRLYDKLNSQNKQTGKLLEEKGVNVYYDNPKKTTHTKLAVIDEKIVILGSHNLTQAALKYNNEISILLDRPDLAKSARKYMLKIIKEAK